MCRQRNSTRNANDVESGSLLEPMANNSNAGGVSSSGASTNQANGEVV